MTIARSVRKGDVLIGKFDWIGKVGQSYAISPRLWWLGKQGHPGIGAVLPVDLEVDVEDS